MARAKLLIPPAKTLRMRMCMRAPSRTPRAHACAKREREGGGRWHVRAHLGRNLRAGRARWWPEFVRKRLLLDRVECVDCFPSVGLSIGLWRGGGL